ncbi:extracellular solute-binding protein [Paenibacillus psychroresistens]|uniref:Extracellular solute-binding protein n=1 Tax=Paenibacillus psychroresistens TaxID=1778678 RepID=A0A6B8RTF1_9BACL|nr:extracellular solute-binding protein [Paenibacillus psychroresistens]QGQ98733.1 extracellular solute-binding protein [Paenibacillus psychroresistens]
MKKNVKKWLNLSFILLLTAAIAACSNGKAVETASPEAAATAAPGTTAPEATPVAAVETAKPDPNAKYEPAIEITTVRNQEPSDKFKEGESLDNNVWTKAYESELGIKVKNLWVVTGAQYEQKLNLSIAANDLPDFFRVNAKQFRQLVAEDKLEDLTGLVNDYGSAQTKEMIDRGVNAKLAASEKGKLMAIPHAEDYYGGANLLYVRTDWLKKLNLPEPKTMDDFLKIANAFTTQDPDGNKKNDTYGLAASKDILGGYPDLSGFMNGYHAYMKIWVKDAAGKLVYGSVQPEMKTALAKLQELYKAGVIDKEFGIKDGGKAAELQVAGKVGMSFGAMWNPLWPLQDGVTKDLTAEWTAYPIPSADGTPANVQTDANFDEFWVVKKGAKNPEAIVKMFNFYNEKIDGDKAQPDIYQTSGGIEVFKYALMSGGYGTTKGLLAIHKSVVDALQSKDASKLNPEGKGYYDKILLFQGGDRTNWGTNKVFGDGGSWAVIGQYYDQNKQLTKNEFFGPLTTTMTEKNAILEKLTLETFAKIILGAPITEFDKYVESWNKLGGEQITKEANEWYANK